MKTLLLILPLIIGCTNVSSTRFTFKDSTGCVVRIDLPKEMEAKNLIVEINAQTGVAHIRADEMSTKNVEGIKAQGQRESSNLKGLSTVVEKTAEGVTSGAIKGIIP